jgi:hypothetical protein
MSTVSKGGHPQFKSAPPQLGNIADYQIDWGVADLKKLRNQDCGPPKFDLQFFSWIDRISRPKIRRKLRKWSSQVADFRKNCDCGIAELRVVEQLSFKSCGISIAEVLTSSCGIAIADSKKSCACPPLTVNAVDYKEEQIRKDLHYPRPTSC